MEIVKDLRQKLEGLQVRFVDVEIDTESKPKLGYINNMSDSSSRRYYQ